MAKVAIFDTGSPKRWVQFDADTEVLVQYLSREDAIQLNKDVDRMTARSGGDRQIIWGRELGKRTVLDWRNIDQEEFPGHSGITFPDGTQIPYSEKNRDMMMKSCREFSLFINETAIDAQTFLEIDQKAVETTEAKNS